jgi:hypothetical protein
MMANNWSPPEGHPISLENAKRLLAGDLGTVLRKILMDYCVPSFWFQHSKDNPTILHNGTVTLVQTPKKLLGITAAHILREYEKDRNEQKIRFQLGDCIVDDILERMIAISDRFDIATFEFDRELKANIGKDTVPLELWPPQPPQEGRGIMLAGFPGKSRLEHKKLEADFGLFTALGIARIINDRQITWAVDREYFLKTHKIKHLPPNYDLGGISGGPLISWFETSNYISYYKLSGIITEANATLETVITNRAECINEDGTIVRYTAFI